MHIIKAGYLTLTNSKLDITVGATLLETEDQHCLHYSLMFAFRLLIQAFIQKQKISGCQLIRVKSTKAHFTKKLNYHKISY